MTTTTTTQEIIDTLNTRVSEATGMGFSFEHLGGNDFSGYADGAEYGLYATIDGENESYTVNFASDGTGLSESAFDLDTAIQQLIRALRDDEQTPEPEWDDTVSLEQLKSFDIQ